MISAIGAKSYRAISSVGGFAIFGWQMLGWLIPGLFQWRMWRLTMPLFYEVGNRTVPVIVITGTFIGLVLANQSYSQLKAAGFEEHMGVLLSVTLMQELGPVFSAVMLAGRVGGALTAELGTMKVTDQISALSVMGTDPIRQLVVPRFLACLMMTPLLTFLCDLCGEFGGWFIAIMLKGCSGNALLVQHRPATDEMGCLRRFGQKHLLRRCHRNRLLLQGVSLPPGCRRCRARMH